VSSEDNLPYPGLRPFHRDEAHIFFGREDCIDAMVDLLSAKRFLAILGTSGIGKSSMVRAGLLPALDLGFMGAAGSNWQIAYFRPGGSPIKNLSRALVTSAGEGEINDSSVDLLQAWCASGPRSIIEWCDTHLQAGSNLLLLIDQFEELFRYALTPEREETEAFIALLIESVRATEVPIYVVMTMSAEFLGLCALIPGLAQVISGGLYLAPSLTREECRQAITGPAAVCDVEIADRLVNRLLNDLANFAPSMGQADGMFSHFARLTDQLSLMQHALNRAWYRARARASPGRITLDLPDYEEIGGVTRSIDFHADALLEQLGVELRPVAERIFQALTAGTSAADAIRRPTRLEHLVGICAGEEEQVRRVIDVFRASSLLLPEIDMPMTPDTIIDISHESLIRQWRRLSRWVEKEAAAAAWWRRLCDMGNLSGDRVDLMQGGALADAVAWREEFKPSPAWARRYGGDYGQVMGFLDRSILEGSGWRALLKGWRRLGKPSARDLE
jgi:hypothetical protein